MSSESFACDRCSLSIPYKKTCIYYDKREKDFCEGFEVKTSILREGWKDVQLIAPDDTYMTYAEAEKTFDNLGSNLKNVFDIIEENMHISNYKRTIIRKLNKLISDVASHIVDIKEVMENV